MLQPARRKYRKEQKGRNTGIATRGNSRSEEHTSELQSPCNLVCRLLLEKKNAEVGRLAARRFDRRRDLRGVARPDVGPRLRRQGWSNPLRRVRVERQHYARALCAHRSA